MAKDLKKIQDQFFDAVVFGEKRDGLVAGERGIEKYHRSYRARMLAALREDFSTALKLMGEREFSRLCEIFLKEKTSSSFTINSIGGIWVDFLNSRQDVPDWQKEIFDFEWQLTLVNYTMRGEASQWKRILLQANPPVSMAMDPGLLLKKYEFPVHEIYESETAGEASPTHLILWGEDGFGNFLAIDESCYQFAQLFKKLEDWSALEAAWLSRFVLPQESAPELERCVRALAKENLLRLV